MVRQPKRFIPNDELVRPLQPGDWPGREDGRGRGGEMRELSGNTLAQLFMFI